MTRPVNLSRYRKQKARAEKSAQADQNAVRFGRSKARKSMDQTRVDKARRDLDGHRRDE